MAEPTIKLSKDADGKLMVSDNGKLCLGCCPGTSSSCSDNISSVCPACYKWNIPDSVTVNLSGLTLANNDYQYWRDGNNVSSGTVNWCNHIWDGIRIFNCNNIDGEYVVPVTPYQGDSSFICGGSVDIPFEGSVDEYHANQQDPDDVCSSIPGDLRYRCYFTAIRISVGVAYVENESPYENYRLTLTVSLIGDSDNCEGDYYNYYYRLPSSYTVFHGYTDRPATPEEDRAGINGESVANTYDTPYLCELVPCGYCYCVDFMSSWGGSVDLTQSETLYQFPVHIENIDPMDFYQHSSYGWQIWTRLYLYDEDLPHSAYFRIKYKYSYDDGEYIGEYCGYSGNYYGYYLRLPLNIGQYPGFTTLEILSITCEGAENVYWDADSDEVPHIITEVFSE